MLRHNEQEIIFNLLDGGISIVEIVRRTHWSPGTVYKYAKIHKQQETGESQGVLPDYVIAPKLSPFHDVLKQRFKNGVSNVKKLYEDLKQQGYQGSYGLLNNYVRLQKPFDQASHKRSKHIETGPGEQAQVDWGSFGRIKIGEREERLYAFVYVLSHSRMLYVEFVVRQNQQTLQNCHMHAFEKLGIPREVRYDNMKTVVLRRERLADGSKRVRYNPAFIDFARYYGFRAEACPPYWPRAKGKVEASVKYVRRNFMADGLVKKEFSSLEDLNEKVIKWTGEVNQRIHRTTNQKPVDLWKQEKIFLNFPIGFSPYNPAPFCQKSNHQDGLIQHKNNFYIAPPGYKVKAKFLMREVSDHGIPMLELYYKNVLIERYKISFNRGEWVFGERAQNMEKSQHAAARVRQKGIEKDQSDPKKITVAVRDLRYYDRILKVSFTSYGKE